MANFVEYVTKHGDRWDTIAFKAYGDASLVGGIVAANPAVVISPLLEPGTRLIIPVMEQADIEIDSESLPPWKR